MRVFPPRLDVFFLASGGVGLHCARQEEEFVRSMLTLIQTTEVLGYSGFFWAPELLIIRPAPTCAQGKIRLDTKNGGG